LTNPPNKNSKKKEKELEEREKDHEAMNIVDNLLGGETLGVGLKFNCVENRKTREFVTRIFVGISNKGKKIFRP